MRQLGDFLAWLGGADKDILDKVPQERGRFVQMACILLTTSGIATISMIFAMHNGVKVALAGAVVLGFGWGLVILNLDRFLVLSMGSTRDLRRLALISVPRLLLAIVVSLVIATPLTLRIFQNDINVSLRSANQQESALLQQQEAHSGLQQQTDLVLQHIKTDDATLAGHLPESVTNPQLQTAQQQISQLQPQVTAAKQQEISAYEAWQCELYGDGSGCANASNRAGDGPIAQAKHQTYLEDLNTYNTLNGQLQTAEQNQSTAEKSLKLAQGTTLASDQSTARAQLPGLEQQYASLEQQIHTQEAQNQNAINQNSGLLAQLSALSAAGSHNFTLRLAQIIVTLLFFFIELLPVAVKFLLNMGPPSVYEKVAKLEDEKTTDKARLDRLAERRKVERDSDEERKKADAASLARIKVAEDMTRREEALGIHANEHVAGKMEEILDAALLQWSAQVQAKLNGNTAAAASTSGGASFPSSHTSDLSRLNGGGRDVLAVNGSSAHQNGTNGQSFGLPKDRGTL
jgi:hypothetical protein